MYLGAWSGQGGLGGQPSMPISSSRLHVIVGSPSQRDGEVHVVRVREVDATSTRARVGAVGTPIGVGHDGVGDQSRDDNFFRGMRFAFS